MKASVLEEKTGEYSIFPSSLDASPCISMDGNLMPSD